MPAKKKAEKAVKKSTKKAVKKTAKKAVKKAAKKTAKKAAKKTAKKAVKKTVKKAAKKTAKKIAKKAVNKTLTKNKKTNKKKVVATAATKKTNQKGNKKVIKTPVKKAPVQKKAVAAKVKKKTAKKSKPKKLVEIDYAEFQDTINASTVAGPLDFSPYDHTSDEDYMSDEQTQHFHKILIDWKDKLMSEVDATVGHLKTDAEAYADPLDRAAQEEGFNLELRTRDRERKLIKKIEEALDWINEGVYGYCEDCGAEIGVRRLEARPTAAKCIDCKTFSEIREKQMGE
jgi:DnaK suppressor protein